MTIKELRAKTGLSQSQFADLFGISVRTLQHWELDREAPRYVIVMLERIMELEDECKQLRKMLPDKN